MHEYVKGKRERKRREKQEISFFSKVIGAIVFPILKAQTRSFWKVISLSIFQYFLEISAYLELTLNVSERGSRDQGNPR